MCKFFLPLQNYMFSLVFLLPYLSSIEYILCMNGNRLVGHASLTVAPNQCNKIKPLLRNQIFISPRRPEKPVWRKKNSFRIALAKDRVLSPHSTNNIDFRQSAKTKLIVAVSTKAAYGPRS
ncbi:hypothetical protein TNIN_309071 [Trichonephila inaurata madagascariensis]|uniref:Uncharacterized protein n=1 Tax=Trichonephila inaurata madagascariensis TaxID=2747483 RepID=A0A8X6WRA4_9ARAC|nr:hypothetical protein TNIN_309071 [Trichonephila inaurata madagascariensis]